VFVRDGEDRWGVFIVWVVNTDKGARIVEVIGLDSAYFWQEIP
jgi:hypothetical protein